MGRKGEDIILTEKAKKFPYSIECKNQENLNMYGIVMINARLIRVNLNLY